MNEGHTEKEIRTIAFAAVIIGNILLILTNLSKTRCAFSAVIKKNYTLTAIVLVAFITLLVILTIPTLNIIFTLEFPGYRHLVLPLIGSLVILGILETIKYVRSYHVLHRLTHKP
jgi:P-type Ca2+ transporter type 2C